MHDFDRFERRLGAALRSDADERVGPFEAESIARAAIAGTEPGPMRLPRSSSRPARRSGRGRGLTLLAAAALLVGGALAAGSGLLRLPTVVPPVPEPSSIAVATASPDATSPSPSESAAPSASPIPVAGPGGVWIPTGSMVTPRSDQTAVRLLDGRVLVVGGRDPDHNLTSAELYDPVTGTWSDAGSISKPLVGATLLHDGTVLVLVGNEDGGPRSAGVYDPASGTWTATGPMDPGAEESDGAFTVLPDGRVLLAGREGAWVYDPGSGTWTATGPMVRDSGGGPFTVLRDGRVLDWKGAQVYDPASGTWTGTGKNGDAYTAAAALMSDGKVLVAGGTGYGPPSDPHYYTVDSAEVYDPVTGSWTAIANMQAKTTTYAAFLQPDGKVLVVGSAFGPLFHAEVYDPATGTWTALPVRPGIRYRTATLLSDGAVLVTGETDAETPACTADLYDPPTGSWTTASTMLGCDGAARSFTLLLDGTVLVAGGGACNGEGQCVSNGAAELYVPPGVPLPPLPAFASPPAPVFPSPTPEPTLPPLLPPTVGPVPPNARSWTVTVDNQSSEPATLFVVAGDGSGLVGSATPNVVPAGATVQVTFLFPADEDGWIDANLRAGEGGGLVNADQIGIPGKIVITAEGDTGWLSP